ncbi:hypothetical protein B566_EDAN011304 [Ephemera danica]|nr:hypothetical protein B566_EDAN011304 [Ephemera danica]
MGINLLGVLPMDEGVTGVRGVVLGVELSSFAKKFSKLNCISPVLCSSLGQSKFFLSLLSADLCSSLFSWTYATCQFPLPTSFPLVDGNCVVVAGLLVSGSLGRSVPQSDTVVWCEVELWHHAVNKSSPQPPKPLTLAALRDAGRVAVRGSAAAAQYIKYIHCVVPRARRCSVCATAVRIDSALSPNNVAAKPPASPKRNR